MPADATRFRASSCWAGVNHHGFALLGRPGKIRKPARAMGREMTPGCISWSLLVGIRGSRTIDDEKPAPSCHATNSIEVLVCSSLQISTEHYGNVVRHIPHSGPLKHLLRLVPRACALSVVVILAARFHEHTEYISSTRGDRCLEKTKQESSAVDISFIAHLRLREGHNRPQYFHKREVVFRDLRTRQQEQRRNLKN